MTSDPPDEAEIVAAIRELGRAVHAGEIDPDLRSALLGHLDAAQDLVRNSEPRRRWYELGSGEASATRARNRELSPFTGALNPTAPPMQVRTSTMADGRPVLIGTVRIDRLREGPPRAVHGGVIAGLFDELLGAGQRLNGGPPGMTGRLTVRYRRPTPLEADLELRVWIEDERTRRVVVRGDCVVLGEAGDDEGRPVTAEAEAIFLRVDFERLDAMMRTRADGETPDPAAPLEQGR